MHCVISRRTYSRIVRNRKLDRAIAATPVAERNSQSHLAIHSLREDLDRVLCGRTRVNSAVYGSLLQRCTAAKSLQEGILLHNHISSSTFSGDTFLENLLVKMYASCGCLQTAVSVFESIRHPNVISWNIMASAYARNGHLQGAVSTFRRTPRKDVVSWATVITAFLHNGQAGNALGLFREMDLEGVTPNRVTFLVALEACAAAGALAAGKEIHEHILSHLSEEEELKNDPKITTALINMYGKCGRLSSARLLLDSMPEDTSIATNAIISAYAQHGHMTEAEELFATLKLRTVSSWNIMIKGYAQTGYITQAMEYFTLMDLSGYQPDTITLVSLLDACANIPALREGKLVHSSIDQGFELDESIVTALLFMYGKCGRVRVARGLFDGIPVGDKTVASWTAMIAAYAHNGHGDSARALFQEMALEGGQPNQVTFNTILCACSHAGLLDHAREYFVRGMDDFGARPNSGHYSCVLDLLGRVGRVRDAEELVHSMPFEPGSDSVMSLLRACSIHGEVMAADRLFVMSYVERLCSSPYVLFCHALTT